MPADTQITAETDSKKKFVCQLRTNIFDPYDNPFIDVKLYSSYVPAFDFVRFCRQDFSSLGFVLEYWRLVQFKMSPITLQSDRDVLN